MIKSVTINLMKKRSRSEKPGVLLQYMMFKDNLGELSEGVRLAEKLEADGIVATNLDYVGNAVMDELRAFSCGEAPGSPVNEINEAESLAERLGVNFVPFPLEMGWAGLCSVDQVPGPCLGGTRIRQRVAGGIFRTVSLTTTFGCDRIWLQPFKASSQKRKLARSHRFAACLYFEEEG